MIRKEIANTKEITNKKEWDYMRKIAYKREITEASLKHDTQKKKYENNQK